MHNRNDYNLIIHNSVHDPERETSQQNSAPFSNIHRPTVGKSLNHFKCVLNLSFKRLCNVIAALMIPDITLDILCSGIFMNYQFIHSLSRGPDV